MLTKITKNARAIWIGGFLWFPWSFSKNKFKIGIYDFNFDELSLRNNSDVQMLTLREAELLRMFCLNMNQVVKRDTILQQVWGEDDYYKGRSLDVFISRLRKFFQEDENINIENYRSVGFKLSIKESESRSTVSGIL